MNKPEIVFHLLWERGLTLSFAESCTGGLLSKQMTDVAGASKVYCGGIVSYWSEVKHRLLHVPQETLDRFGAVSAETAIAMAEGCRGALQSDIALSVTGVAGPEKDDRNNPVGTVYLGIAAKGASFARLLDLSAGKNRADIRSMAAEAAFSLLEEFLSTEGTTL